MNQKRKTLSLMLGAIVAATPLFAQQEQTITVKTTPLAENIYMLAGAGGNIALLVGDDGTLLVDSDYASESLSKKIAAAVAEVGDESVRMVLSTHWHFDHVGGNAYFHKAGAVIAAHENVRERMSKDQVIDHIDARPPASPEAALPTMTYAGEMTLYWNGEEVRIIHVPNAHTDGDSFVYFRKANVLHVADTCFAGMYPFIDVNAGGTIDGMIAAADVALKIANEDTKIVPGHGPLSTAADLREYRAMLTKARDAVGTLIKEGKSREEAVAAEPTKDLDAKWGVGAFPPDLWVAIVYDSMTRRPGEKTSKP